MQYPAQVRSLQISPVQPAGQMQANEVFELALILDEQIPPLAHSNPPQVLAMTFEQLKLLLRLLNSEVFC